MATKASFACDIRPAAALWAIHADLCMPALIPKTAKHAVDLIPPKIIATHHTDR